MSIQDGHCCIIYDKNDYVEPNWGVEKVDVEPAQSWSPGMMAIPTNHLAVNACLAPICSMHGLSVTTVEGIGSTKTKLHPVQERIARAHGSQCGFCTPGIVMSMYTLLRSTPKPKMADLEVTFQGNLCRCTGYRPIIEGYHTFTEEYEIQRNGNGDVIMNGNTNDVNGKEQNGATNGCPMGDQCCKLQNGEVNTEEEEEVLFKPSEFTPYDKSQEVIFPPELKLSAKYNKESLIFRSESVTWYRPTTLAELLKQKSLNTDAKIVGGNTEVGVEVKFKNCSYPVIIHPNLIPEMKDITIQEKGIRVGAAATLTEVENFLHKVIKDKPEYQTRIFSAIVEMLHWFAGKQIRNVGTVGGNIMTGSPISDLNPIFLAANIQLELQSKSNGTRFVPMDDNFFTGYRRNVVTPDEILISITIPFTEENQYFWAYKQARRRDDDIAIVNNAINVIFEPNSSVIKFINLAFGGMAPITITARKTKEKLIGYTWNEEMLEVAYSHLLEDLPLSPSAPGGMTQYRRSLTLSLFFRGFLYVSQKLLMKLPSVHIDEKYLSAIEGFHHKVPKSSQYFQVVPKTQEKSDMVGRPMVHESAYKQATGEAVYCNDMPILENELHMAFVFSQKAYADVINIDPNEALRMEGVRGFFSGKDVDVKIGTVAKDEEIFYSKRVTSQGQIMAAVVADTKELAQKAAKAVKVTYEELEPIILSFEDAIKHKSFYPESLKTLTDGDVDKAFQEAPHIIEGECRTGGQEHFYMETQSVICVPKKEDYEMEIFSSTQHPTQTSKVVSEVLGIPQHKVITRVKRIGGGFGGKEGKSILIALPAAIAASRLNRPVRVMLDRDEDIALTGGRNPFYFKYKIAFDGDGKILGVDIHVYNNAGYSRDNSLMVLDRAFFHIDNAYKIANLRIHGYSCKTNLPSNTAFRGFGAPQAMFAVETMMRHIADYLGKDVVKISELNLYKEGDLTHYKQTLSYCTLHRCWSECIESSRYYERKKLVDQFNGINRFKKRGLSVVPTKFGIGFGVPFMGQGGALILVYTDGSVLLSHGGTEMGQGLHTKMLQVASRVLEIPVSKIHITETTTDKVPNTSPTAGSTSSEINGMAVIEACETIKERLRPFKEKNPKGTWDDWVKAAYFDRVSLSATGFYKTPIHGFDFEKLSGEFYEYYSYGVAISEVEIDCLTGDHQILRTDIVMDLGESLNPAIDIGQIEGAFMQGYGLFVLEEMMYSPTGMTYTRGPGTYKLPGFADIPVEFNVSLLKGAPNPTAIYSSKSIGEPPLFLASSILFAIKDAIKAARKDSGVDQTFILDAPATSARIRMACLDNLTRKLDVPKPGSFIPWNIDI